MDLHYVGQARRATASEGTGLIGGAARIADLEIVFQMMVRANKQEQTTAGG
jgi:hypothetical protein